MENHTTSRKFSPEVRERAVRMVLDHRSEHPSQWAAIVSIAAKMRVVARGRGWTFVAWGLLHGFGLIVCRIWQRYGSPIPVLLGWLLTALFVLVGWVLFRAPDFTTAQHMLVAMASLGNGLTPTIAIKPVFAVALVVSVLVPSTQRIVEGGWLQPAAYQGVGFALLLLACILIAGQGQPGAFTYFQF